MTKDNDILTDRLFDEIRNTEIEDNGFSRRVMKSLPDRESRLAKLWTALCVLIGIILSFAFHVWELLAVYVEVFIRTIPTLDTQQIVCLPLVTTGIIAAALWAWHELDPECMSL